MPCVQVVPDKIGDKASSYNDFICALPDNQCRYAGASGKWGAGQEPPPAAARVCFLMCQVDKLMAAHISSVSA